MSLRQILEECAKLDDLFWHSLVVLRRRLMGYDNFLNVDVYYQE